MRITKAVPAPKANVVRTEVAELLGVLDGIASHMEHRQTIQSDWVHVEEVASPRSLQNIVRREINRKPWWGEAFRVQCVSGGPRDFFVRLVRAIPTTGDEDDE